MRVPTSPPTRITGPCAARAAGAPRPAGRRSAAGRRARGFSFTEVLFAVMILGIGFIMVAAIFPVAIQQARNSSEETAAAAVSRGAANFVEKVATESVMPVTNNVVVGPDFDIDGDGQTLATALRGSAVTASDNRYAWVPLYRRAGDPTIPATWSRFAQVFMIPVLIRNESEFKPQGGTLPRVFDNGAGAPFVTANLRNGTTPGAPDTIVFNTASQRGLPSEGAFVIIGAAVRSGRAGWNARVAPQLHGRIYRLGNPVEGTGTPPSTWELMPGFEFDPINADENGDPADGAELRVLGDGDLDDILLFVIGRGVSTGDPGTLAAPNWEGMTQDVSAFTTFVTVK